MIECYIIGKIGDLPEEVYKANFQRAKAEVQEMGMIPISPVDLPHNHDRTWGSYMKEDIARMVFCPFVYVQKNWRHSPGGIIELNLAKDLGLNIIFQK